MMEKAFGDLLELCSSGQVDVHADSRLIKTGDIFVAIPGESQDGAKYIAQAMERGATRIVCKEPVAALFAKSAPPEVNFYTHADPREALWRLARARWNMANPPFKIIGVTGTNGKTTSAFLLEHIYKSLGLKVGVLGTVDYHWPGFHQSAPLTTPDPLKLYSLLAKMAEAGVEIVVMEVSSHALAQQRVSGLPFSAAIFTNLTRDHLDFHRHMEDYFRTKSRLFLSLPEKNKGMAINCDDAYGRRLLELLPTALSYGIHQGMPGQRHLKGTIMESGPNGMRLKMTLGSMSWELRTQLVGDFNALNLLGVQAAAIEMGVEPAQLSCLESFSGVRGRLERIPNSQGFHIFVDYAHTPDALVNALRALRGSGFKRIIAVFGCGGNRDRSKRPLMGQAVAENADIAILTTDNPRFEDPETIITDVKPGLARAAKTIIEIDRRKATARALELLEPDDALLIAGKGHEDYQIIKDQKFHYSDQEVVRELLSCA